MIPAEIRAQIEDLPNASLVQEVFDLIQSDTLLRGNASSAARAVEEGVATIVTGYIDALGMAHSQEVLFRYRTPRNLDAVIELCWGDINENELAPVWGALQDQNLWDKFNAVTSHESPNLFWKMIKATLPEDYFDDLADEVDGAMRDSVASRIAYGRGHQFYERVFRVYQLGGWPCGWDEDNQRVFANFPEAEPKNE